jgi:hypothetical protein
MLLQRTGVYFSQQTRIDFLEKGGYYTTAADPKAAAEPGPNTPRRAMAGPVERICDRLDRVCGRA